LALPIKIKLKDVAQIAGPNLRRLLARFCRFKKFLLVFFNTILTIWLKKGVKPMTTPTKSPNPTAGSLPSTARTDAAEPEEPIDTIVPMNFSAHRLIPSPNSAFVAPKAKKWSNEGGGAAAAAAAAAPAPPLKPGQLSALPPVVPDAAQRKLGVGLYADNTVPAGAPPSAKYAAADDAQPASAAASNVEILGQPHPNGPARRNALADITAPTEPNPRAILTGFAAADPPPKSLLTRCKEDCIIA
jgi:hypothetical protein